MKNKIADLAGERLVGGLYCVQRFNVYHVIFLILSHAFLWEQSAKYYSGTQVPADIKILRAFNSMHDVFEKMAHKY